jgi:ATP-dependent Clp protease ATP-binding subunit ClpC
VPTHRYPVLVIRDPAGGFTAVAVDEEGLAGVGTTAAAARDDLKGYLEWAHRKRRYTAAPDFRDPELHTFRVNVRPEYKTRQRIYPSDQPVAVRVPCVTGVQASGQRLASLPLLGLRFTYHEPATLKGLVQRYALQKLEGLTPRELARHLALPHVELADVVVRLPREVVAEVPPDTPFTLGRVAEPLGERAVRKQFARAWERDAEVATLVRKLHREKANVLLVGEPGVGKTTLLVEAVREVERRLADEAKKHEGRRPTPRRFWQTSAGRIIAGMKYLGQWEERVEALIGELGEIEGVLCVDRLLDLVRTGGLSPTDSIAAFVLPYLTRGELRLVAEATPSELDACRRLLPGLADVFQILPVEPFDRAKALAVLDRQIETSKANLRVAVGQGVSDRVVQLFRRFMPYSVFPGQAAGFTRDLIDRGSREKWPEVTATRAVTHFMTRTGLPELFLRDEITLDRSSVLDWFRGQVIDQPEACEAAANVVLTFKAGLNDPHRPLGVLLFCGPTGVGKTEMAQALARYFFGAGDSAAKTGARLIRLDMSEYAGPDAVERLIGPPHGEPSELIRKVRQQPFTVLLFDEIEKASPDVFDVLLGVFDEGRLTDRFGRVTNFRSALIVMTSNLGADRQSPFGFDVQARPRYRDEAMAFFRPEFFNRLDAVVTFHPLGADTIRAITRKELATIAAREGLSRAGVAVRWTDRLVDHLADVGFDARYGARPLQRTIEREVVAPLAKWLLERPGLGTIIVEGDWRDGAVVFRQC